MGVKERLRQGFRKHHYLHHLAIFTRTSRSQSEASHIAPYFKPQHPIQAQPGFSGFECNLRFGYSGLVASVSNAAEFCGESTSTATRSYFHKHFNLSQLRLETEVGSGAATGERKVHPLETPKSGSENLSTRFLHVGSNFSKAWGGVEEHDSLTFGQARCT